VVIDEGIGLIIIIEGRCLYCNWWLCVSNEWWMSDG
jgi:hypothetical protein